MTENEIKITKTRRGYLVEIDSNQMGERCGLRIVVPKSALPATYHDRPIDEVVDYSGTTVRELICDRLWMGRVLRWGVVVE